VCGASLRAVVIGQGVSCIDVPGYHPMRTLRTPASLEFGDSRRAPAVRRLRVFHGRREV
jgi:hypothetical protein